LRLRDRAARRILQPYDGVSQLFLRRQQQVTRVLLGAAYVLVDGHIDFFLRRNGTDEDHLALDGSTEADARRAQQPSQQHGETGRELHSSHSRLLASCIRRLPLFAPRTVFGPREPEADRA